MRILDWYIGRTIISTTVLSWMVLASVSGLFRFIDQLKSVGKGSYDIVHAALFTLYSVPTDIEIFFPMSALIGGLVGLGTLAQNSELIVMQSAGLSRLNIIKSVMKSALVMILVVMAVAEWGAPEAQKSAREIRARAISGGNLISAEQGVWAKDGDNFVNIGEVEDTGQLRDITIYEFDQALKLTGIISADYARYIKDRWQLTRATNLRFEEQRIAKSTTEQQQWVSTLTPDKLGVVAIKRPEYLSIGELIKYLDYLAANNQEGSRYELAFWRKIFQPFTIGVMLLVALSFIFGPLRSVTMGARVILGIITGFLFYMSNQIFGPVALVYRLPPIMGALLPSIMFIGVAVYFLRKRV